MSAERIGPGSAPEIELSCVEVVPTAYAAGPSVTLRMRAVEHTGVRLHALALRCQVRIEPLKRRYDDEEAGRVTDLFGDRPRWGSSMHPLQLSFWSQVLPGFSGATVFDLEIPVSYDVEVAAHKYLSALGAGEAPLLLLFSGQTFTVDGVGRLAVQPLPWHTETTTRLPVDVWRAAMDEHYPGQAWLRVSRDLYDRLAERRSAAGAAGWDALLEELLR